MELELEGVVRRKNTGRGIVYYVTIPKRIVDHYRLAGKKVKVVIEV